MKTHWLLILVAALVLVYVPARAQQYVQPDSLGLPGDNLNLYAVLQVFQESPTLEEFEETLNSEESMINNLDLDCDGYIDYIRVVDNVSEGDRVHTIVLQVPVGRSEIQDIAVIVVDRDYENRVYIQVIGDEELYGPGYIIEPNYDRETTQVGTPNPGYQEAGSNEQVIFDGRPIVIRRTTTIMVASWPLVQYIYRPAHSPWLSPWYFGYYPSWWRPWRPFYWHEYWGYHYPHYHSYYRHYHRWNHYHHYQAHIHYAGAMRASSRIVMEKKREGAFRETYSRPDLRKAGIERYNTVRQDRRQATIRGEKQRLGIEEPKQGIRVRSSGTRAGTGRLDEKKETIETPKQGIRVRSSGTRAGTGRLDEKKETIETPKQGIRVRSSGTRARTGRLEEKKTAVETPERRTGDVGMKRPSISAPEKKTTQGAVAKPAERPPRDKKKD